MINLIRRITGKPVLSRKLVPSWNYHIRYTDSEGTHDEYYMNLSDLHGDVSHWIALPLLSDLEQHDWRSPMTFKGVFIEKL